MPRRSASAQSWWRRKFGLGRLPAWVFVGGIGLLIAQRLDRWAYFRIYIRGEYPIPDSLWELGHILGRTPIWGLVAFAQLCLDLPRWRQGVDAVLNRAGLLFGAPILAGIAGELLKAVLRRERPPVWPQPFGYSYRPWTETWWQTNDLGLPSTHLCVAAAGAAALFVLHPRLWPLCLLVITTCGLHRLLDHAHYLSDVWLGSVVGVWAVYLLYQPMRAPLQHHSVPR